MKRFLMRGSSCIAMGMAAGLGLLLAASCTVAPSRTGAAVDQKLAAACKANYKNHDWKLADPPEESVRNVFTVPRDARTTLWFRGRDRAIAVCTPCGVASAAGGSAVRSFEWYSRDFKDGELGLKNCNVKPK